MIFSAKFLCRGVLAGLLLFVSLPMPTLGPQATAATRARPVKDHHWHLAEKRGRPLALALPCPECRPDLIVECLGRRPAVVRIEFSGASVSNGRHGASKQIRITVDGETVRRRVITQRTERGYTPHMIVAADDALLEQLANAHLVGINFYGQRSFVGAANAKRAIAAVRSNCGTGAPSAIAKKHCIWNVVLHCGASRAATEIVVQSHDGAFVRKISDKYCAVLATRELAHGLRLANATGGTLERSCLK